MLPNVIIGGAQKAGTTSLFRYLSAHPSVCPSKIKEIHFFLKHKDELSSSAIKEYQSFFALCSSAHPLRVEASPLYLMESGSVAEAMYKILPNIKLVFILREPISLIFSYIKYKSVISNKTYPVELFSQLALNNNLSEYKNNQGISIQNAYNHLKAGCYAERLKDYLAYYPSNQIGIFFFDELSKDPHSFTNKVCGFLDIESEFYNDFQFKIENKTRSYKYPKFHQFAVKMNTRLEILFNRYPFIRDFVRSTYHALCETSNKEVEIAESEIYQLEKYYGHYNTQLNSLLKQVYPELSLPLWVEMKANC